MKKRGQIILFILVGMMIFTFLIFVIFIRSKSIEKTSESEIKKSMGRNLDKASIVFFIENCLKQVSERAVFARIGLQGGYIEPAGNLSYGEDGAVVYIADYNIPYYLFGGSTYIPSITEIEKKIANYVIIEFERCSNFSIYERTGFNVTRHVLDYVASSFKFEILPVKVNVSINDNNAAIRLHYPVKFRKKSEFIEVSDFANTISVSFGSLYNNASNMALEIASSPGDYNISKQCNRYNLNGFTEIYYRDGRFIEFIDYSSLNKDYKMGYSFRFGVNGVDVNGNCTI